MKFAQLLRTTSETLPDVESLFKSYKLLKKQVKQLPGKEPAPRDDAPAAPDGVLPSCSHLHSANDAVLEQLLPVLQRRHRQQQVEAGPSEPRPSTSGLNASAAEPVAATEAGGSLAAAAVGPGVSSVAAAAESTVTEEERAFVATLTATLHKHNEVFLEKEEQCIIQLERLEANARRSTTAEQRRQSYARLVDFHGEVLLLMHWSVLAYTATVKILKKHHKRTGLRVIAPHLGDLLSQPFCSTEMMTALAHKAEHVIVCLSGTLAGDGDERDEGDAATHHPHSAVPRSASPEASSAAFAGAPAAAAAAAALAASLALVQRQRGDLASCVPAHEPGTHAAPAHASAVPCAPHDGSHPALDVGAAGGAAGLRNDATATGRGLAGIQAGTGGGGGGGGGGRGGSSAGNVEGPCGSGATSATTTASPGVSGQTADSDCSPDSWRDARAVAPAGGAVLEHAAPVAVLSGGANIVHRTQVALTTWERLRTTAVTPSTVLTSTDAAAADLRRGAPPPSAAPLPKRARTQDDV